MKAEIMKMLDEARDAGTLEEKIRVLWGGDGVYCYKLGEIEGWHRGHTVARLKMAIGALMGIGATLLIQAFV